MSRTTATFSVSVPPEMAGEIERVRKSEHRTRSELVREALRHYIRAGRVPGAYKLGRDWFVPDAARLPAKLPPGRKPGK